MNRFLIIATVAMAVGLSFTAPILAQAPPTPGLPDGVNPEVDITEVLRRGDSVQYVDGTTWRGDGDQYDALAPPKDDNHKWFISVICQRNCPPCERLKRDWRSNVALQAYAVPGDPAKSWAHYNEYWIEDESQKFRWEKISLEGFPTILIQPPRDGAFGDWKTPVFHQTGYDTPQSLTDAMSQAMLRYADKIQREHPDLKGDLGANPPWKPAPKNPVDDDSGGMLDPHRQRPRIFPPPQEPVVKLPELRLLTGWEIAGVAVLAFMVILLWRQKTPPEIA